MKSLSIHKKAKRITSFLLLLIFSLISSSLYSQELPQPSNPPRLVNDLAGILGSAEVQQLESKLVNYNDTTSTQILVLIINDLNGYDVADYAYRIGETWGVGKKGQNNGAVIIVKPKTDRSKGKAYIATGYGLEGVIPDALAKRIVEKEMIPAFMSGDYYGGIDKAVDTMIGLASGLYSADQYDGKANGSWIGVVIILIILLIMFRSSKSNTSIGSAPSGSLWAALWLASQANRSHSGSWGGFTGGSGGSGGGGFGGFGGGSFGGGGAGGSW
ncbi:MAG: hypothetical protein FD155_2906 [Bacteroidetes bacterium]|nr:MAG: hypothetical protein FD155_2906 [Bacteroidota bacterium]